MALREITLCSDGGPILFEIVFGHANVGGYRLYQFDRDEKNPVEIGSGNSKDHIPDRFFLADGADNWQDRHLTILADLVPTSETFSESSGQYSLTIHITQSGKPANGSPVFFSGEMCDGVKSLRETLRFTLA